MATKVNKLALDAAKKASIVRRSHGIPPNAPVSVYDLVIALGIELRFLAAPSMEGIYQKGPPPAILLSSLRPRGRKVFNCAHELGHHVYGHGLTLDQLLPEHGIQEQNSEEYLADAFARSLLMSKNAIDWAFNVRGWIPSTCNPSQLYTIACWLDVGYETLVRQLRHTFHLIEGGQADNLLRSSPKEIRSTFLGGSNETDLLVVDEYWQHRSIDIDTNDIIAVPLKTAFEGKCIVQVGSTMTHKLLSGTVPGVGRIFLPDTEWAAFIRVSRTNYIGRGIFRHEEDVDDE